jgi:hypothetical protein
MDTSHERAVQRLVGVSRGTAMALRLYALLVFALGVQVWARTWETNGRFWLIGIVGVSLMVVCMPLILWAYGRQLSQAAKAVSDQSVAAPTDLRG